MKTPRRPNERRERASDLCRSVVGRPLAVAFFCNAPGPRSLARTGRNGFCEAERVTRVPARQAGVSRSRCRAWERSLCRRLCRKNHPWVRWGWNRVTGPAGEGAGRLERVDQKVSVVRVPPLGVGPRIAEVPVAFLLPFLSSKSPGTRRPEAERGGIG